MSLGDLKLNTPIICIACKKRLCLQGDSSNAFPFPVQVDTELILRQAIIYSWLVQLVSAVSGSCYVTDSYYVSGGRISVKLREAIKI